MVGRVFILAFVIGCNWLRSFDICLRFRTCFLKFWTSYLWTATSWHRWRDLSLSSLRILLDVYTVIVSFEESTNLCCTLKAPHSSLRLVDKGVVYSITIKQEMDEKAKRKFSNRIETCSKIISRAFKCPELRLTWHLKTVQ